MHITSIRTRAAIAAAATALGMLAAAEPARGGSYGVAICNPDLRAWHNDAAFSRTSTHYGHAADCGGGGEGLSVASDAQPTKEAPNISLALLNFCEIEISLFSIQGGNRSIIRRCQCWIAS